MPEVILLAHNIRSAHNVGALFRTADGLGVAKIICSGYTPHPRLQPFDSRLPHVIDKVSKQIHKTALGAEKSVPFSYEHVPPIEKLKSAGYRVVALEQHASSQPIQTYTATEKIALMIGEEVQGVSPEHLSLCDDIIEIPMQGAKESLNVSVAAGIALFILCQD